jgi:hypothetical protein
MTDKIIDLGERQAAKKQQIEAMLARAKTFGECAGILANALEQMWKIANREQILKALRFAVEVIEEGEEG